MAEAGRHLLAAYPEEPPVGALAFAVVAAHADGQEEDEHRLAAQLLETGRAMGEGAWLDVLDYVIAPWHPDETAELLEPYLVEHPEDRRAHRVYAHSLSAAYQKSNEAERASSGPLVVSKTHVDPAQDMAFGSTAQLLALAGRAGSAPEGWAKAWLDEPVPALRGLTPREAAASDDQMDVFRVESLLRQFEYQAGLAEAAGLTGTSVAWLRTELNMEEALDAIG
jgi:hypothetical protein